MGATQAAFGLSGIGFDLARGRRSPATAAPDPETAPQQPHIRCRPSAQSNPSAKPTDDKAALSAALRHPDPETAWECGATSATPTDQNARAAKATTAEFSTAHRPQSSSTPARSEHPAPPPPRHDVPPVPPQRSRQNPCRRPQSSPDSGAA